MSELITNSRCEAFKACRKRHYWAYECRIRRDTDAKPLRMGTAYHHGLDALKNGEPLAKAIQDVRANYESIPDNFDVLEWDIER